MNNIDFGPLELYKSILTAFNELCSELSFADHEAMLEHLLSNTEGFPIHPLYQKEAFKTGNPMLMVDSYNRYSGGNQYCVEEFAQELFRQCQASLRKDILRRACAKHYVPVP